MFNVYRQTSQRTIATLYCTYRKLPSYGAGNVLFLRSRLCSRFSISIWVPHRMEQTFHSRLHLSSMPSTIFALRQSQSTWYLANLDLVPTVILFAVSCGFALPYVHTLQVTSSSVSYHIQKNGWRGERVRVEHMKGTSSTRNQQWRDEYEARTYYFALSSL